jgi:hypothetical protein
MKMAEGWHKIKGYEVYTNEKGYVRYGVSADGNRTIYPYRKTPCGCWNLDQCMSIGAFSKAVSRGNVEMF